MSFLKNVWSDLVERRLWPVAVAMVVALIAIPVVLGRTHGSSGSTPATPLPATSATPAAHVVSLSTSTPKGAPLGKAHNPFPKSGTSPGAAPAVPTPTVAPVASSVTASGGSASSGSSGSGSSAPAAPVSSPAIPDRTVSSPSVPHAPAARVRAGFSTNVTYGRAGSAKPMNDLARLDPLNAINSPVVLYLGVKDDQKTALFMVLADVAVSGDGVCRPSTVDCQVLGLKAGDAELIDVPSSTGSVYTYQLQINKIAAKTVASAGASRTARHRESKAGRSLLRQVIDASRTAYVANYRYSVANGVLVKDATAKASSAASSTVPALAPVPAEAPAPVAAAAPVAP